jgi:nucleoside-diphosphate-sugar epimerase
MTIAEQGMAIWLLTGASGFLGRHVLDALKTQHQELAHGESRVVVLGRRCPFGWPDADFVAADLHDSAGLRHAMEQIAPDFVVHTAGKTPPAQDDELYRANFWGTMHLLSALRPLKKPVRVVLSGSAAELGKVDARALPVDESYHCDPRDAYGRSKWLATVGGLADRSELEVLVARVFNPIGPGLPETQVFGRFAARLNEPGPDPVQLSVGDLDSRRDFIDVRDVARAAIALALRGRKRLVYHVGTGQSHRVGDGLDVLIRLSGRKVNLRVDPSLGNRHGPADSRADTSRIVEHTGWQPRISWQESLADLWRETAGHDPSITISQESAGEPASVHHAA